MALKIFFTSQTDVEILHSHISMAIANCLHWNRCTKYPTDDDAVPDQTREKLVFCTNRAVDAISLQKDCQRCEQKHLITKHSIFMRRMGLPSGSCCHCFVCMSRPIFHSLRFTIHNSNGSSIWTKCVLYLCALCVLTEIRAKIQQTCAFKWTNIYLFMCLQSWNLCSINELCPLANALDYHHRTHSIERLDYDNVSGFRFTALI